MVDVDKFGRQVAAIRRRVAALRARADGGSRPDVALVPELFGQLAVALDHLTWARDELRRQQRGAATGAGAASGGRYFALYEAAPCPYVVTDLDGTIQDVNHAARAWLNLPEDPARSPIGDSLASLVADEERASFRRDVTRLRWVDWLQRPHRLRVRLQPRGRGAVDAVATVVAFAAAGGKPDTLAWIFQEDRDDRRGIADPPRRESVPREAPEMVTRVDDDLIPVVGALGLSLRHPNLPPDLRVTLGQAAVALDGAVQWMEKLRKAVHPDVPDSWS